MTLRQAATDMRDVYANEIAREVAAGRTPSEFTVRQWRAYDAQVRGDVPVAGTEASDR